MLDSHVDECNVAGRSEAPAGEILPSNVPKVKPFSPNVQTQKSDVERCTASSLQDSFKEDYSLPDLPLKSLVSHMDIMGRLREQCLLRDFLGFESSPHSESVPEISKDDACPVPYFIPELEMHCARATAGHIKELTLAPVEEEPDALEIDVLEPKETCPLQIEEISVSKTEEQNVLGVEEVGLTEIQLLEVEEENSMKLDEIKLTSLDEPDAPEMAGSSEVENAPEKLVIIPVIEEPPLPEVVAQEPIQIEKPMITVIEKPMPSRGTGFISSLIGHNRIWRPSVSVCFGDRERRFQHEEEIKQQTSKALKSLILYISIFKMESGQITNKLAQLKRGTVTNSRVLKQNVVQPTVARVNRQEKLPENTFAGGEPIQRNPIIQPRRIRVLYNLDASDGWARNSLDSDSSDSCDSDDSGINTSLSVVGYSRDILKIKHSIANRQDIENSGRILFSKPVTLFRFNSVKKWQREGNLLGPNVNPYTGDIKILERSGLYYILLRENNSSFLLVYTRIDGSWQIGYTANETNSCGWFNFNYAFCPEGTPEHFACSFQEPSHAAEFVARVRNLVIKARFLNSALF